MKCRHCHSVLDKAFLDLGFAPPSNAYLTEADLTKPEVYFPLKLRVCRECWLVQTEDYARADELFRDDYAYFSSVSKGWLEHAAKYAAMVTNRFSLSRESMVIEIASNDGYLLKNFVKAGIPCLGIEPTASTADAAELLGVPVVREFFGAALGRQLRTEGRQADLIAGNNVYAHVPDINDFTQGMKEVLKPEGVITLEFPHLLNLLEKNQFDTVYHEHFSYLSLYTVCKIFEGCGLRVFDVEQIPTHGGSIRVYGCHHASQRVRHAPVEQVLLAESESGLQEYSVFENFQSRADQVKDALLSFLIEQKRTGKKVVAYGAAAKGNTLLNYGGVKPDLLSVIADAATSKQGKFMPGSHIPIVSPEVLTDLKPDYVVVLPWNIAAEVMESQHALRRTGAQFVTAVPQLKIVP